MLFGDLAPLVRPLSRRLACSGWWCAAVGLAAGLMVALGTGERLSGPMEAIRTTGVAATAAAALLIGLAVLTQPVPAPATTGQAVTTGEPASYPAAKAQLDTFLLAAVAMLLGAAGFAGAGWFLPSGASPQSLAFSQIFLLGSASCWLTYLLLHKVLPVQHNL